MCLSCDPVSRVLVKPVCFWLIIIKKVNLTLWPETVSSSQQLRFTRRNCHSDWGLLFVEDGASSWEKLGPFLHGGGGEDRERNRAPTPSCILIAGYECCYELRLFPQRAEGLLLAYWYLTMNG